MIFSYAKIASGLAGKSITGGNRLHCTDEWIFRYRLFLCLFLFSDFTRYRLPTLNGKVAIIPQWIVQLFPLLFRMLLLIWLPSAAWQLRLCTYAAERLPVNGGGSGAIKRRRRRRGLIRSGGGGGGHRVHRVHVQTEGAARRRYDERVHRRAGTALAVRVNKLPEISDRTTLTSVSNRSILFDLERIDDEKKPE